jgi:hypothetical protein
MDASSENRVACKVGLLLAGINLALASAIWMNGSGEGWIYLAFFHLPTIALWQWLFPHVLDGLGHFGEPVFFSGICTISSFVFGWAMTRIVALYG